MGFFGFLKKKPGEGLLAPSKPGEKPEPAPIMDASLDDVPAPDMQGMSDTLDPRMMDAPPVAPDAPLDAPPGDDMPADTPPASPAHDTPESVVRDLPSMLPESLMAPAPRSAQRDDRAVSVDAVLPVTEEEDIDALPVQGKTPEQPWTRPERVTASHELPISQEEEDVLEDIPDFSPEDIARAEEERHAEEQAPQELKPEPVRYDLPDLDDIRPPQQPPASGPDELYVPAVSYRDAISNIKKLKTSAQRGETSMSKLSTGISEHAEQVSGFADALNEVQEQLLAMDNIMLEQR